MEFKKVNSGDALDINAKTYNAMVDAAVWVRQYGGGSGKGGKGRVPVSPAVTTIKNATGALVERFRAICVDEPITLPEQDVDGFKDRVITTGVTPDESSAGRWVVVQEPMNPDEFGPAVVVGVTVCWINLNAVGDTHVEVEGGSTTPKSGTAGSGQILWVKGGVGSATTAGEQWAVIKLGGGSAKLPTAQYQWMVYMAVSQNQMGFEFVRAHALL